ncbi:MAG: SgcJ/EcaC family oxidoreductase [Cyclobacteriaceae bacterium]|nr:SgcJ/EcaC family oxidoreductase [Cyclobacteriaceae bacterium]
MIPSPIIHTTEDETIISDLYQHLLKSWNERDAAGFSSLFIEQSTVIGFDGSQMNGPDEIQQSLEGIFKNHLTARYVWKIREVRFLSPEVAVLKSVVGMVHPDHTDIDSSKNAVQSMVAMKHHSNWLITVFQNTPASFDGHPVLSMELTNELQQVLNASKDPLLV